MNLKRILKLSRYLRCRRLFSRPWEAHKLLSFVSNKPEDGTLEFQSGEKLYLARRKSSRWLWDYILDSESAWPVSFEGGVLTFHVDGQSVSMKPNTPELGVVKHLVFSKQEDVLPVIHRDGLLGLNAGGREVLIDAGVKNSWVTFKEVFLEDCYRVGDLPDSMDTVVDLGANVGMFAIAVAPKAGRIISVEAMGNILEHARANVKANGVDSKVTFVEAAMAGESGRELELWAADSGVVTTTTSVDETHAKRWGATHAVKVQTLSLPDLFNQQKVESCDLLKVDIEASEFDMFEGIAPYDLRPVKRVMMEVHLLGDETRVARYEAIKELLNEAGFHVWAQPPKNGEEVKNVCYLTASRVEGEKLTAG